MIDEKDVKYHRAAQRFGGNAASSMKILAAELKQRRPETTAPVALVSVCGVPRWLAWDM